MHYPTILTPAQSSEMHEFLRTLILVSRKAKKAGIKPDISKFINEWRPSNNYTAKVYNAKRFQKQKKV